MIFVLFKKKEKHTIIANLILTINIRVLEKLGTGALAPMPMN
jgi:hypothetical protein